jgi:Glycosyl transferases group 1
MWPQHDDSRSPVVATHSEAQLRVCMPVFSFRRQAYRTGLREAQDILAECADVDLIDLDIEPSFGWKEPALNALCYHAPFRMFTSSNPGLRPVRLTREYDVLVAVCPYWRDVANVNAVVNWRNHCRTSICWIDELWAWEIADLTHWLPILERFDHIVVGISGTGRALTEVLGRVCHEVSGAVDVLKFGPLPNPPRRVIDILSIGRRIPPVHDALLNLAARDGLFYVYDTAQNGNSDVPDFRAHRRMYGDFAKRSQVFMVSPGKMNLPHNTRGQVDLGFRYFEGAAAGAALVGLLPDNPLFRSMFDWPDAVIAVRSDGSDTAKVVSALLQDPEKLRRIGNRNMAEMLRRHDWVHRWRQVFSFARLPITSAMTARETQLAAMADGSAV